MNTKPRRSGNQQPPLATIRISNLRLRTFIGFNPEEREKKQDVVINIEIRYAVNEAALEDEVEEALNYRTVTKRVIRHVEEGRFLLVIGPPRRAIVSILHIARPARVKGDVASRSLLDGVVAANVIAVGVGVDDQ